MTDHPSTFQGPDGHSDGINWDDRASLHRTDDGKGLLDGAKALRRGTFADLIRHMMLMPSETRQEYCIQKTGDRRFSAGEVEALAARPDFPRGE